MPKTDTAHLSSRYCVTGRHFRIKDVDPGDTLGLNLKERADALLQQGIKRLQDLQEKLYAQDRWSLLLVFQALDAAGKDSTIKHVMSGVNPQGCVVTPFKQPTAEELDHDFLWRCSKRLPERGQIGIFNRSYYEEVLVVRVHPELLAKERLPEKIVTKNIWKDRFRHIRHFEEYLVEQGTVVRKFFLHVSKEEQRQRFLRRLDQPHKRWKFSTADVLERQLFADYMNAYEDMIRHTATKEAPWHVVPADNKWFTQLIVAAVIIDALESIKPSFPKLDDDQMRELGSVRAALEAERQGKSKTPGNQK
jgi:PPK2 family polyphosphate:nucleotide phosphotransferase